MCLKELYISFYVSNHFIILLSLSSLFSLARRSHSHQTSVVAGPQLHLRTDFKAQHIPGRYKVSEGSV